MLLSPANAKQKAEDTLIQLNGSNVSGLMHLGIVHPPTARVRGETRRKWVNRLSLRRPMKRGRVTETMLRGTQHLTFFVLVHAAFLCNAKSVHAKHSHRTLIKSAPILLNECGPNQRRIESDSFTWFDRNRSIHFKIALEQFSPQVIVLNDVVPAVTAFADIEHIAYGQQQQDLHQNRIGYERPFGIVPHIAAFVRITWHCHWIWALSGWQAVGHFNCYARLFAARLCMRVCASLGSISEHYSPLCWANFPNIYHKHRPHKLNDRYTLNSTQSIRRKTEEHCFQSDKNEAKSRPPLIADKFIMHVNWAHSHRIRCVHVDADYLYIWLLWWLA